MKDFDSKKWFWMMDYCKKHGLAPANSGHWKLAEKKYYEFKNGGRS